MTKKFRLSLLFFVIINLALFVFIIIFNQNVPNNYIAHKYDSYHYIQDSRITQNKFNIVNALAPFDAQWYLRVADKGYPTIQNLKYSTNSLTYAFFPLYPITVAFINLVVNNIETSAFIAMLNLLLAGYISLVLVISKIYNQNTAIKTAFLTFLFPFSIFFRSYFTESLFILLLTWFGFALIKKKWLISSITIGLLLLTKGNGLFLIPLWVFYLIRELKNNRLSKLNLFSNFTIGLTPFIVWVIFCEIQTHDPLFFLTVRQSWFLYSSNFILIVISNLGKMLLFFNLPFHTAHFSKLDVISFISIGVLLKLMKNKIHEIFWWISFLLWLGPFFTTDLMSFTRYEIVSFPIFLFLSLKLNRWGLIMLSIVFACLLFLGSLYFVNWYWLG